MKKRLLFPQLFVCALSISSCTSYRPLSNSGVVVGANEKSTSVKKTAPNKDKPTTTKTTSTTSTDISKSSSTTAYIQKYKGIAIEEMNRTGIPASITLSQGILESASGNSDLAVYANNHFGIKCTNDWSGDSFHKDDDRPDECFRKYPHAEGSFHDHSEFLKRPRYASLYKLDPADYQGWAYGLKSAGYATHPEYATKLIDLIHRYDLTRFDKSAKKSVKEATASNSSLYFEQKPTEVETDTTTPVVDEAIPPGYYVVKAGDTLYGVAKKFNLKVEDLVTFNKLETYSLEVGQRLKVVR